MALKAETKEKLKAFGFDVDKLIEAITKTEETDFAVPEDVTVIKTADLATRDANNRQSGKTEGMSEGEKKGKELAAKSLKKKLSLADTVPNDLDKVLEAANEQLTKGDDGLKEQIGLLQQDKARLEREKTEVEQKAKAAMFDSELISHFPATRTADLTDAERLLLVKANLQFEEHEGKMVVKRNGEIVRDTASQSPLAVKDVVQSLFTEKKWIPAASGDGGRGGGDTPPGGGASGIKKMSAFQEKWKAENPGKDENGQEFQAAVGAHAKENTDFDWYG